MEVWESGGESDGGDGVFRIAVEGGDLGNREVCGICKSLEVPAVDDRDGDGFGFVGLLVACLS